VIHTQWERGYQIMRIAFGTGKWIGVFADSINYPAQGFEVGHTLAEFKQKVKKRQSDGFVLIDLAEGW
jgi:gamma-glutamyltranspeptidase